MTLGMQRIRLQTGQISKSPEYSINKKSIMIILTRLRSITAAFPVYKKIHVHFLTPAMYNRRLPVYKASYVSYMYHVSNSVHRIYIICIRGHFGSSIICLAVGIDTAILAQASCI